jgi:hypothetical protein
MTKTLSKAAEEQIIAAVKRAVSLVDEDELQPDAAIEKVAREAKWGAEMIRFASCAYNTARQAAQREIGKTALDKLAEFPLADPDKVIAAIYPDHVKSAVAVQQEDGVSAEYSIPPNFAQHRLERERLAALHKEPHVKAACCTCPVCGKDPCETNCGHTNADPTKPNEPGKENKKTTYTEALNNHNKLKKKAEEARHQAAVAYDRMLGSLDNLLAYFTKHAIDRVPFYQAETAAQVYYGDAGTQLMDWIYKRARLKEARAADAKFASAVRANPACEPYNLIRSCFDRARNVTSARLAEKQAKDALDAQTRTQIDPFVKASAPQAVQTSWSLLAGPEAKTAEDPLGLMLPSAAGVAAKGMLERAVTGGKPEEDRVNSAWMSLEDPAHDAQLRQIRSQAMLADLMNDEVIGSHDPETVLNKYNEIAQMAPRTAMQPIAMRTLLRRHLSGNIEPFEARELAGLEKDLVGTEADPNKGLINNESSDSILSGRKR